MNDNDRESLLSAVNALVRVDDGQPLYKAITELLPMASRMGAQFSGGNAVMNPLLRLAVSDPPKFARVVQLIEAKRTAAGLPPLVPPEDTSYDKTEYMRDFMAQKRDRERRAAKLENLMRPHSSQLKGRSRVDFMQMQSARWKTQRDTLLEAAKASRGRPLRKEEIKELLAQFWGRVDQELNDLEAMAHAEKTHTLKRG